jgi:hypothetical protein
MTDNKTVTINEVEYNLDDFTDKQMMLFNHVSDLERKIKNARFNMDQLLVGRDTFAELLVKSLDEKPEEDSEKEAA